MYRSRRFSAEKSLPEIIDAVRDECEALLRGKIMATRYRYKNPLATR